MGLRPASLPATPNGSGTPRHQLSDRPLAAEPHPQQRPPDLAAADRTLGEHIVAVGQDREPHPVPRHKIRITGDVERSDVDPKHPGGTSNVGPGRIAQATVWLGVPGQSPATAPRLHRTIVRAMRPTTAAVVLGLLVIILAAFLIKAQTSGFTP